MDSVYTATTKEVAHRQLCTSCGEALLRASPRPISQTIAQPYHHKDTSNRMEARSMAGKQYFRRRSNISDGSDGRAERGGAGR